MSRPKRITFDRAFELVKTEVLDEWSKDMTPPKWKDIPEEAYRLYFSEWLDELRCWLEDYSREQDQIELYQEREADALDARSPAEKHFDSQEYNHGEDD
jgi:hypothetical protein